jgi:hypothetical protein
MEIKMKKLLLALAGLTMTANCFAGQLMDYNQVKTAVTNGESIRIATDFSKCTPGNNTGAQPKLTLGVFSPDAVIINADGAIKTALKHFTLNEPTMPGKAVYQYIVYTMNADNSMKVSIYVLDAVNYSMLSQSNSYQCTIADGAKIYSR